MSFFGFITGPCSEHTEDCGKYDARDGVIVAFGTLGGMMLGMELLLPLGR